AKGSARSVTYFNLYDAMDANAELFLEYGGHHMAAGMSAHKDELSNIKEKLSEFAQDLPTQEEIQTIDLSISLADISIEAIKEVDQLKPFGTGNQKPLVAIHDVNVNQKRKVGEKSNHLKLLVQQDEE